MTDTAKPDEPLPLPVALRHDELTERDWDAIYRAAKDEHATVGRLRRMPRRIPEKGH